MKVIKIVAAAALAVGAQQAVGAPQDTGSLTVSANVQATCSVQNATLAFNIDPVALQNGTPQDASTDITVQCSKGLAYEVGIEETGRTLTNGVDPINFELYTDTGYTTVWGDTEGTTTLGALEALTGTGSAVAHAVYGRIAGGQTASFGTPYASTDLTITIYYE